MHSNATLIYTSSIPYTISHIRNLFYNQSWFHHNFHHAFHYAVWVTLPSHFFRDALQVALSVVLSIMFSVTFFVMQISGTCVTVVCYVVLGWCVTVCGWRYVVGEGVRVTVGGMTIRAW